MDQDSIKPSRITVASGAPERVMANAGRSTKGAIESRDTNGLVATRLTSKSTVTTLLSLGQVSKENALFCTRSLGSADKQHRPRSAASTTTLTSMDSASTTTVFPIDDVTSDDFMLKDGHTF